MITQSSFPKVSEEVLKTLREKETFLIVGHKNPDGDTLSSTLALKLILEKTGKRAYAFNSGPFLRREVQFLEDRFQNKIPESLIDRKESVLVFVDCSTEDRSGSVIENAKDLDRIIIDHHASSRENSNAYAKYIVPTSPSTTLLIDKIREMLNVELDKEIAYFLYLGLLTDTGFFHFLGEEWGPYSLERASRFLSTGLSAYDIYDYLTDGKSLEEIKKVSRIIEEAKPYFDGRLIIAEETDDIKGERVSDQIYETLLKVENIEACVFIKRKGDSSEIGFRAKKDKNIDVGEIALSLGGGGHALASGATVELNRTNAKRLVIDIFSRIFKAKDQK